MIFTLEFCIYLLFERKVMDFKWLFLWINVFIAQVEDNGVTGVQTWKSQT